MEKRYEKSMEAENKIYEEIKQNLTIPDGKSCGFEKLDEALDWLCDQAETILDFGCGNGSLLFYCAYRGVQNLCGIDLAEQGIECAKLRANQMPKGKYELLVGSLEQLQNREAESVEGIILSNLIDNLYPEDARSVLKECKRILKKNGKVLIKLNPYITKEQIQEWNLVELEKDVYDNGMILWNRTDEEWEDEFNTLFALEEKWKFLIPQADLMNRLFLLRKIPKSV